jgi:hypothetical protein
MVTKGYRKGVYKWVTLGIRDWLECGDLGGSLCAHGQRAGRPLDSRRDGGATNANAVWGGDGEVCRLPAAL